MTRWAKAVATSWIIAEEVAKFFFENICCRFGTPLGILSDRGLGFRADLVGELMEKLGIKRRHSTPYYLQCNGLVEKINGMICKIITKSMLETSLRLGTNTLVQRFGLIILHSKQPLDILLFIWYMERKHSCP